MQTIVDEFLKTAQDFPSNKAVSDETGSLTYEKLNYLSDIVASKILSVISKESKEGEHNAACLNDDSVCKAGASAKTCQSVGVLFPRKKEALAAFLGVLKSGSCYVYASPDVPDERFDFIMDDAAAKCIVTTKESAKAHEGSTQYPLIFMEDIIDEFNSKEHNYSEHINLSDCDMPAFLTYTSGSTGTPKGVIDTYYYIKNHNDARHFFYKPAPNECIGNIVSFSYAASTYDLFSGLTVGCNLYIFSDEELLNQQTTIKRVLDNNITTMFMIPNMISVVFAPGVDLPIKYVITAGEKAKQIPDISARIAEIYGSSEAAAVIGRVAKIGDPWNLLGKPMPGNTLFLVDDKGEQINTPNTPGELCIVSDALALGYLNRDKETNAHFVECPFLPGKRMYKSGDLMEFDECGVFYYCGRKDHMTKINGQRVEMGEIESNIVSIEGVKDAVCVIVSKNNADMLVCYYVQDSKSTSTVTSEQLEAETALKLPRYMVPLYWVRMDSFPKNINGKVDRKALPIPDFNSFLLNEKPENEVEAELLKVAHKFLPDIQFGVTDDLMKLGMDSILAVKFVAEAEKLYPEITASDVMRLKTIRKILSAKSEVSWFYADFDNSKDTIVLVSGIIPVSGLSLVCDEWSKLFNVLVIEPFLDHINTVCSEYDYETLVDFYVNEVSEKLIENAIGDEKLWGFAGFSFGGQLAASLAAKWKVERQVKKRVFMGDTLIQLMYPGKVLPVLTEDDPYIQMVMKNSQKYGESPIKEPLEQVLKKQNAVIDLMRTIKENTEYDGSVFYLDTKLDYDKTTQEVKIGAVKTLYANVTILEFPQNFHNDLYMKAEFIRHYGKMFDEFV